jgi:hypothetical protein
MLLTAAGRHGNFPAASGSMTGPVYITVRRDPTDFVIFTGHLIELTSLPNQVVLAVCG